MIEIVKRLKELGLDAMLISTPAPYLRIGYWKEIPFDIFKEFKNLLREEELQDEDCGTLYSYYTI